MLVVFSLFFIGLFALDMVTPDRSYSELENTTLSQRPALTQFTAKGLNSYFTAYTKYVKDQVAGRDQWISLQSVVETTLLQKQQNGGILLGREHMMFPRTFGLLSSEERTLPKNTSAVESRFQRYPGKVNVLLAPAASDIYPEIVPANAPLLDENTYLDQLSAAVQAAGHLRINVNGQNIDMLSLSGHKFHGPKGVGVLYAWQGIPLTNIIEGGAQERGKRGGTENTPAIAGMAAALREAVDHMAENAEKVTRLRETLIAGLSTIEHARLNGDRDRRVPGTVSF